LFSGMCPLAGNSIYMDRTFIKKYMPKLESQLSYRLIDVSTLKELFKYGLNIILILINNVIQFTKIFFIWYLYWYYY
jgi:oligoribonuclease (3'-5' exoribonuclease)